jgi:putative oxidoreductase
MDTGLLIGRLVVGSLMAAHGAQKLFGWFGGYGLVGTGAFFDQLGFRPGQRFAAAAGAAEAIGGALIALGLFGPVGPALMLSVMIVAAMSVHWSNGVFAASNGIEVPLLYASAAVALAFTGPGQFSLDSVLGFAQVWTPGRDLVVVLLGIMGGVANLIGRRRAVTA